MMNNRKQINIQYYDSPCGRLVLASFADSLCLCDWSDNPFAERNRRRLTRGMNVSFKPGTTSVLEETKRQLDEYFAGKRKAFDIQLRLTGTDFRMKCGTLCSTFRTERQRVIRILRDTSASPRP